MTALSELLADPAWAGSSIQLTDGAMTSATLVNAHQTRDSVDAVAVLFDDPLAASLGSLELQLDGSLEAYERSVATVVARGPATLQRLTIRTGVEVAVGAFAGAVHLKQLELPGWIFDPDDVDPEQPEDVMLLEELTIRDPGPSAVAFLACVQWPRLQRLTLQNVIGPRGIRALLRPDRTPALEELTLTGEAVPWFARLREENVLARLARASFVDAAASARTRGERRCMHCGDASKAFWDCERCRARVCRACREPEGHVEMCIDCVRPEEPEWLLTVSRHGRRGPDGKLRKLPPSAS